MEYMHFDLGPQRQGSVVEVELSGTEANVQLVDSTNFQNYKNGRQFTYFGGHYKASPVRLTIPHAGNWYVTVDLGGFVGQIEAAVRVIS